MVPLEQRQLIEFKVSNDPELKQFVCFLRSGKSLASGNQEWSPGVQGQLLATLAHNDGDAFKKLGLQFANRQIKSDSEWIHDDYLVFLLLVGNEKFDCAFSFVRDLIEARRANNNALPQKVNEVFAALFRREYALQGELCFLKIPYLKILGKLELNADDARKAFASLIQPGLSESLSPFLNLLAIEAYDTILFERRPVAHETATQVITDLEAHAKELSLKQWWKVFCAVPFRVSWPLIAALLSLFYFIPAAVGFGYHAWEKWSGRQEQRIFPDDLVLSMVAESSTLPVEANLALQGLTSSSKGRQDVFVLMSNSLGQSSTPFTIEASNSEKPIVGAFAFACDDSASGKGILMLTTERSDTRFRAIVPSLPSGERIEFVVVVSVNHGEKREDITKRFTLRTVR